MPHPHPGTRPHAASADIAKLFDKKQHAQAKKTEKERDSCNHFLAAAQISQAQQDKLLLNERHEAWENLARKLAHEIKNPLTPIQLTIDRIKTKFSNQIDNKDKSNFEENLKIINNQIKQIGNLVNEFSDFARMPKPILKENDIVKILNDNINLVSALDKSIKIRLCVDSVKLLTFDL